MKRVVITGVGMVSPLGINAKASWNSLLEGRSGLVRILERSSNPNFPDVYMGLIPKEFDFEAWKVKYCNSNLNAYTMAAVEEALVDSGVNLDKVDRRNCVSENLSMKRIRE
jgi:3-oxoacyl-[acyl-carrier-protein] synthase II